MILRLSAILMFAQLASMRGATAQQRPSIYVDSGACPFECCRYGTWSVTQDAHLLAQPADTAKKLALLRVGDTVQALTGHVRTSPTPFLLKQTTAGSNGRRYTAGDTLWALTYLGEGDFRVWWRGEVFEEALGFSPYGGTPGERCERCTHGELLHALRSEWWIRIRTRQGVLGWTRQDSHFDGDHVCR